MNLERLKDKVLNEIIPQSTKSVLKCKTIEEAIAWRSDLQVKINQLILEGESPQDVGVQKHQIAFLVENFVEQKSDAVKSIKEKIDTVTHSLEQLDKLIYETKEKETVKSLQKAR